MSLAMRQGSKKIIYNFDRSPVQVYDLDLDPNEKNDISKTLSAIEIEQAKQRMLEWSIRTKFTFTDVSAPK